MSCPLVVDEPPPTRDSGPDLLRTAADALRRTGRGTSRSPGRRAERDLGLADSPAGAGRPGRRLRLHVRQADPTRPAVDPSPAHPDRRHSFEPAVADALASLLDLLAAQLSHRAAAEQIERAALAVARNVLTVADDEDEAGTAGAVDAPGPFPTRSPAAPPRRTYTEVERVLAAIHGCDEDFD